MQNPESSSDESSSSNTSTKYKPEQPSRELVVKPSCECKTCTYWTSSAGWCGKPDLEFEKKREKQEINKKYQPVIKTADFPGTLPKIVKFSYDNFTTIQKKSVSRLFVHSPLTCPQPVDMVSETYFDNDMQTALRSLNYLYSLPLQSFVWPAIFRQMNVFMVNGKQSGKTMSYLPAMCSFAMQKHERYAEFAKYKGPLVIILCPNSEQCGEIYDLTKKLMQNIPVSVHVSNVHSLMDIRKVDILITIPRVLIECLKARHVNLKRVCHLVIEGGSCLMVNHEDNIYTILRACNEMLQHRNNSVKQVQIIVSSRKWTSRLEKLMKNLFITPMVCIGDQLEAALYGKVEFELHFSEKEQKSSYIQGILKNKSNLYKTVVVCNDAEISELNKNLVRNGIETICLSDQASLDQIQENEKIWQTAIGGQYPVFLCSEFILKDFLTIDDAMYLVHYSLPNNWNEFINRFGCLSKSLESPLDDTKEKMQTKSFIMFDETNEKLTTHVVKLFSRFPKNLPPKLASFIKGFKAEQELNKIKTETKLCPTLKLFGECRKWCKHRHLLSKDLDILESLPQNGKIVFKILAVKDVTCYMVQLIRNVHLNGTVTEINNDNLSDPLDFGNEQKKLVKNIEKGEFYAHCEHDRSGQSFVLCQVMSIENSTFVEVKLTSTGQILQTMHSKLYQLPTRLKIVEMYFSNLVPAHKDGNFSTRAYEVTMRHLRQIEYRNITFTADVHLQLNQTIWVHNIVESTVASSVEVIKFNLKKLLLEKLKIVEFNSTPITLLYHLCLKTGIELPNYSKPVADGVRREKVVKEVKPQWAFLGDDIPEVVLSSAISPDEFYLRHSKFQPLLENLEKDIEISLRYDILDKEVNVIIGKYYLAPSPQQDKYARALVVNQENDKALCFYVDYGDESIVTLKTIRTLPANLITKLPFQAIQCSLHGIKPVLPNGWDEKSADTLYEYMFEPNSVYFRSLYAKTVKHEKNDSLRSEFVYSILLKDGYGSQNKLINRVLVDCGQAQFTSEEEIDDFFLPHAQYFEQTNFDYDTDDFDIDLDEYEIEIINPERVFGIFFPDADSVSIDVAETGKEVVLLDKHKNKTSNSELDSASNGAIPKTCGEEYETGSLTPEVWWSQTDTQVKIKIKLIGVSNYKVAVKRNILFTFWTELNEKVYELKMSLSKLAKLDQHEALGQEVVVNLTKINPSEWVHLTATEKRMRHVHYEIPDKDLKEEKKLPILTLGVEEAGVDEDDGGLVYEIDDDLDSDLEPDKAQESDEEL